MAVVYSSEYQSQYRDEPKSFVTGVDHVNPFVQKGKVASASASDKVYFGKLPEGCEIYEFKTKNGVSITLEDGDGNSLSQGDETSSLIDVVAVPASDLSNDIIYLEYFQN